MSRPLLLTLRRTMAPNVSICPDKARGASSDAPGTVTHQGAFERGLHGQAG